MSIEAVAKALHLPNVTPAERLILIGIANHDGDGGSWPSIDTLAAYACVEPRTAQRTIRQLETKGQVVTHRNAGGTATTRSDRRPNRYEIIWSAFHSPVDKPGARGDTDVAPHPERGDVTARHGVTPTSPEPSLEPSCITSENRFTREALISATEKIRAATPSLRQNRIDNQRATRLTEHAPQPPIEACALALLGEPVQLQQWTAQLDGSSSGRVGSMP